MARREDTKPGLTAVEPDSPERSHHGTPSELVEQVTSKLTTLAGEAAADHMAEAVPLIVQSLTKAVDSLRKRESSWPLVVGVVSTVLVLVIGAVLWSVLTRTDDCNQLVVEHVLHQADAGEAAAAKLEPTNPELADAIRDITSADRQPDNVRLCVLIQTRKQ